MLKLTSIDPHWYFISNLIAILDSIGIKEHIPQDTPYLKYSTLKGKDIRILNRLYYFWEKNKLKDVRKIFGNHIFTQKVVSTQKAEKERVIELITSESFFNVLKKYNISKGIELEENLLFLLCLSPEKLELIMIAKLLKVFATIRESR